MQASVIYFSNYGCNKIIGLSIADGLRKQGALVHTITAQEVLDNEKNWDILDQSDLIVFGAPTYMGSIPAQFKAFMDGSSDRWFKQKWRNKFAAGFTHSSKLNGDKLSTLTQLAIFAAQHSMIWISLGLDHNFNRLGAWLGLMSQSSSYDPVNNPNPQPHPDDIISAEMFGERLAKFIQSRHDN